MNNIIPFILAIANRCRGGLITVSSGQLGRMFWAIPFGATLFFGPHPETICWQFAYCFALIGAAFGGACLAAWGKYDTIPTAWNPWMLTVQGVLFTGPASLVIGLASYFFDFDGFNLAAATLASALTIAPCYWLGWQVPSTVKGFERGIPMAEIIYASMIGLSIFNFIGK